MAVPALPSDDSDGNDWTASKVNAIYDHLQFHRDDKPCLRVTSLEHSQSDGGTAVPNATTTVVDFSDGSGTFNDAPDINVGGFAAGTGGNEEIIIPETGVYLVTIHGYWDYDAGGGSRSIALTDNGSLDAAIRSIVPANTTGTLPLYHAASGMRFFTASDLIGMSVYQNSGGGLDGRFTLTATWINSATS